MSDFATRPAPRADVPAASRAAAALCRAVLGDGGAVHVTFPDGSTFGDRAAPMRVVVRSTDAFVHLLRAPGELGLARAYVSGALDVTGDLRAAVAVRDAIGGARPPSRHVLALVRALGSDLVRNPPPIPDEEIDGHRNPWTRHTKTRDASSINHHYDVSNDFYRLVLGPSMTYSCAVFTSDADSLEDAQRNKYELVCRKLALRPGMRLLDVGCGWGGLVIHAARHHGVAAVGVTISEAQHAHATAAVRDAGLGDRVEIRLQDERDIADGPFDAISSIGMFEHVGLARLGAYFSHLHELLAPGGRLLNHQIGRPPRGNRRWGRERTEVEPRGFIHRYVFPDGELHEIGDLVHAVQDHGFEVRHVETLREHYARTLTAWGANLDADWTRAATLVGEGRARVWRLYMAASAAMFETNRLQVHQILAVHDDAGARPARLGWRPDWDLAASPEARSGADVIDLREAVVRPGAV